MFLDGLLGSYVRVHDLAAAVIGVHDPRNLPAPVLASLRSLLRGSEVRRILDAGYPDAEIVAARRANHRAIAAHRDELADLVSWLEEV